MLEIAIAIIVVACIAGFLVNKWLNLTHPINIASSNDDSIAAINEQLKLFDGRINDTWGTISSTKEELKALKLAIGLKGNRSQ